jgi:hypothetical protein
VLKLERRLVSIENTDRQKLGCLNKVPSWANDTMMSLWIYKCCSVFTDQGKFPAWLWKLAFFFWSFALVVCRAWVFQSGPWTDRPMKPQSGLSFLLLHAHVFFRCCTHTLKLKVLYHIASLARKFVV